MKTALLALVLAIIAPLHITLPGGVTVAAGVLMLAAEIAAAAGSIWLAVRILRPWFRRYFQPAAGGGAW